MDATRHEAAVAGRPAYSFLLLVLGLHFTVGSLLQVANPAFGVSFGELFFFAAIPVLFARAQNFRPVDFLALRLPPARTVGAAAVAAVAGFFFAGALNAVNRWLVGPEIASRYDITGLFDVRSGWEGALLLLGVAVLAPIGEELTFRGYLFRVLGARHGAAGAVIISAVLFALIHLNPASVLALFGLGVIFALLRLWTGSLWPAVLAHAVQNGTSSALVLLGLAEDAPDEMAIGSALVLLAITAPILWLALHHLRQLPAAEERAGAPIAPEADHAFRPSRVAGLAAAVGLAALACVGIFFAVDGEMALARLQRAAGVTPQPPPELETPELPLPE